MPHLTSLTSLKVFIDYENFNLFEDIYKRSRFLHSFEARERGYQKYEDDVKLIEKMIDLIKKDKNQRYYPLTLTITRNITI